MFIGVARHCIQMPAIVLIWLVCLSNLLDLKPYLASSYTLLYDGVQLDAPFVLIGLFVAAIIFI